jgi:hypothetical protein
MRVDREYFKGGLDQVQVALVNLIGGFSKSAVTPDAQGRLARFDCANRAIIESLRQGRSSDQLCCRIELQRHPTW